MCQQKIHPNLDGTFALVFYNYLLRKPYKQNATKINNSLSKKEKKRRMEVKNE